MAIDFRVQDFFYPHSILRLRGILEKTQWLAPGDLGAYQESLLARTISQACAHVPYYRNLFREIGLEPADIRTVEDLKKLPLMNKDTLRSAGEALVADNARRYRPVRYQTSGTTGAPVAVFHGRESNALEFAFYWRHWSWAGYRLGQPFADLQTTHFLVNEEWSRRLSLWQLHLRRLLLNSSRVGPAQAAAQAREIRRRRCRYIKGLASTLYCFALSCRDAGVRDLDFQAVFSTGEVMLPHYRRLIESVFHGPVLDAYGHMERTAAITQCPRGGYHVNADYGVLELVDLSPAGDGRTLRGRAVGTSLHNPVMPLLRYDIGDEIEVDASPRACSCGRTLPLIRAIRGRAAEAVVTPDGRFLTSLYVVPDLVKGIRHIQYIQKSSDALEIRIVPDAGWNGDIGDQVLRYSRRAVGPEMRLLLRLVGEDDLVRDPSGKVRGVVSRVDLSVQDTP
jgi:phenylacetate-CoA ligase